MHPATFGFVALKSHTSLWYQVLFIPFTMVPRKYTPSALVQCTFHSLHNGTMHMHTIRSSTMHFLLPSQWYHAHAYHPLWYNALFTPFTMVPCTCTPSALVQCTFHSLHNGTTHMHTLRSVTMRFSLPSH